MFWVISWASQNRWFGESGLQIGQQNESKKSIKQIKQIINKIQIK